MAEKENSNTITSINRLKSFPYFLNDTEISSMSELMFGILDYTRDGGDCSFLYSDLKRLPISAICIVEEALISSGKLFEALTVFKLTVRGIASNEIKLNDRYQLNTNTLWAEVYAPFFDINTIPTTIYNPFICKTNRQLFSDMKNILNKQDIHTQTESKDKQFSNLVSGKKIIVLGPAPIEIEDSLSEYDTIILINYRGTEDYSKWFTQANKIVSYYN